MAGNIGLKAGSGGTVTVTAADTASNFTLTLPAVTANVLTNKTAGTVLQVVSTTKTDSFSTTSSSYTTITGLTASITPSSSTSKILVIVNATGSQTVGANDAYIAVFRNSTQIALGDAAGNRPQSSAQLMSSNAGWSSAVGVNCLDSPSTTSAITYSVQTKVANGNTAYINRGNSDSDVTFGAGRTVSSITVMEIAA